MSAFPASPVASALKIRSIQPTLVSTAHSLQRQVRSRGGHRWLLSATWAVLTRPSGRDCSASPRRSAASTHFTYVLPGHLSNAQGAATGTRRSTVRVSPDAAS